MIFDIALGIFLFLSPIFTLIGNNGRVNGTLGALQYYQYKSVSLESGILQTQFFQYGILALFVIALAQKQIRDFKDSNISWFLGLCMFGVFLHPKTIPAFIPVFLGCLLYYLTVKYLKNIKPLLYLIFSVSLLNTVFAVLQFFGVFLLYKSGRNIFGLMCSASHLGTYQALALPICYFINPFLAIIPLIGLFLSKSFTPMLAGAVGMIYFLYPKRKQIFINLAPMGWIVVLTCLGVFLSRNFHNIIYKFSLRLDLWGGLIRDIYKNPLGYGLGTFFKVVEPLGKWQWNYNEYLGIAYSIGIIFWFFIYRFLKGKFSRVKTNLERVITASCLIAAIVCLGQSSLHFPRLSGTIIILFGALDILKRKELSGENKI